MSVPITVTGRLIKDPELRFSAAGVANVKFTVVTSRRRKVGDVWTEEETSFWRCVAFRQLAENIAESLVKGDPVIAVGRLRQVEWDGVDGGKRRDVEIIADQVGPNLQWHCAPIRRTERGVSDAFSDTDPWALKPAA